MTARKKIDARDLAYLKSRVPLPSLIGEAVALHKDCRTEYLALCPFHSEDTPSFRVYGDHYHCFGCGAHGDAIEWLTQHERMSFIGAVRHLRQWTGTDEPVAGKIARKPAAPAVCEWLPIVPVPAEAPALIGGNGRTIWIFNPKRSGEPGELAQWRPSLVHFYRTAAGELAGYVLRVERQSGGKFTPAVTYCQNKAGERRWCIVPLPSPRPLYGLEELLKRPCAPVLVVEGEKTADAGRRLLPSLVLTSWAGGSKAYHHTDWTPLKGRKVAGLPDNDKPGREAFDGRTDSHGQPIPGILEILAGIGADTPRRIEPPASLPDGWDLADAERDGWDTARALAWIKANLLEPRHAAA
jgi:hypothetical protein